MKIMMGFGLALLALAPLLAQDAPETELRAVKKQATAAAALKGEEGVAAQAAARKAYEELAARQSAVPAIATRAHLGAGRIALKQRDMRAAEAHFKAAQEGADSAVLADALGEQAALCQRVERREEAAACLKQIVERCAEEEMDRANALLRLGEMARQRGSADEATEWFRRVLNEHGSLWRPCVDSLEELVEMQLKASEREGARRLYDSHALALRARFAGSSAERRLDVALNRLAARAKFDTSAKGG